VAVVSGSVMAQGVGAGDRVVAESLDVQETPVGRKADLAECGQIGQPLADRKVGGVVDGGFGAQRPPVFVVLLDAGVLVVHVQVGSHPR
jgi:hypothetical protein